MNCLSEGSLPHHWGRGSGARVGQGKTCRVGQGGKGVSSEIGVKVGVYGTGGA